MIDKRKVVSPPPKRSVSEGVKGAVYRKWTPEKRTQFLAALAECGNVTKAAEICELNRVYLYRLRNTDEVFANEWKEAEKIGALRLEDEARRRAVEGWEEPVWHRGEMCGTVRKYSDILLICLLKAHHPEKYTERQKVDQNVTVSLAERMKEVIARGNRNAD